MKVLGLGFGRTGTSSLKMALDHLGFGPTLHNAAFTEVQSKLQKPWHFKANGAQNVPWSALTEGYESVTDWPAVYYWRQMISEWPDAPVILTVRPVREWMESMRRTIVPNIMSQIGSMNFQNSGSRIIIGYLTFNDDFSDENMMRVYAKHVADVKAAVEPGRLLVFNVKDGWGPLCRHLGVPVPDVAFPTTNDLDEFERDFRISMHDAFMGNQAKKNEHSNECQCGACRDEAFKVIKVNDFREQSDEIHWNGFQ